jgi:hypothetical protein
MFLASMQCTLRPKYYLRSEWLEKLNAFQLRWVGNAWKLSWKILIAKFGHGKVMEFSF